MKNILLYFSLIVFMATAAGSYCQDSADFVSISEKIIEMKKQSGVRSLIAGVWKGDEEIFCGATGESMTGVPAEANMHLRIGGVSETFLGTLFMLLVENGKINPDDRISKWLPELYASESVTLEMLMNNTAGYKDYVLNEKFTELITKEPFRNVSRKEIFEFADAYSSNNFTPGSQQKYSHTEFTILGEILEQATGKRMAELYDNYIFTPLGLKHTGYCRTPELPSPVLHSFSTDRKIYEDATYWNPSWTGESGSLYSNIRDLGKWAHVFGTGQLLNSRSFEKLISKPDAAKRGDLYFASGFVVANGWFLQNPDFNGYSGAFGYYPPEDLTVIVYTTQTEDASSAGRAFSIFKELVKVLTPKAEINF